MRSLAKRGKASVTNIFSDKIPLMGQDPHITKYGRETILCESQDEERIVVSYLNNNQRIGTKIVYSKVGEHQVWAPELHQIAGLWYIYYSSSDGKNKNHRMKVLGAGTGPFGPYHFSKTLDTDNWGIDMTVFKWAGNRYSVWSGWENNNDEFPQHLYIAPLISPVEIGERVKISSPVFDWELGIAAINEGPQAWIENEKLYLLFSANASWTRDYATGVLELVGDIPLNPKHWIKCPWPLMKNAGHGMMVDDLFTYHRKMGNFAGWSDREITAIPKRELLKNGNFNDFKGIIYERPKDS